MSTQHRSELSALVNELALVLGGLAGTSGSVGDGPAPSGRQWVATLTAPRSQVVRCTLAIEAAGAAAVAQLVVSEQGELPDATVAEVLRNGFAQALTALAAKPSRERVELTLAGLDLETTDAADPGSTGFAVVFGMLPGPLAVGGRWTVMDEEANATTPSQTRSPAESTALTGRIDVLLDIDLPVVVRFGRTEMPIRTLTRLAAGSVIDLGRSPDEPVEVLVSGRVIAHGEVVIVGGNYGVRITDVVSPSERMRWMEA